MPRAFLAIALPVSLRATFVACREAFLAQDPAWADEKWVAEENLHVTLRFLGIASDPACEVVTDRVRMALSEVESYRLRLDTVRAIPRPRSASLLWVGPSVGGEETAEVSALITEAVSFLDFEPDGHRFKAHITLCRARHPRRVISEALDEVEHTLHRANERAITMSVREVTLFASTLTPRGPRYEQIAVIPLGR